MKPLTYSSAIKLAMQCESKADSLPASAANFKQHNELMERAKTLRRIANGIADQYINRVSR